MTIYLNNKHTKADKVIYKAVNVVPCKGGFDNGFVVGYKNGSSVLMSGDKWELLAITK